MKGIRANLWWVLLALYTALIFFLSTRPNLSAPVSFSHWDKIAHLIEYAGFGWLGARALGDTWRYHGRGADWIRVLPVILGGLSIAILDEVVQSRVPGRDASIADFAVDGVGLIVGGGLARLTQRRRQ